MRAIHLKKLVKRDGEVVVKGLPCKKGQYVEMTLMIEPSATPGHPHFTANQILHSELIGLWKNREDIEDSASYARQLREQAQRR